MISLVPAETPVTSPKVVTVATFVLEEVHGLSKAGYPLLVNWVVEPTQTLKIPVIIGTGFTITIEDSFKTVLFPSRIVRLTVFKPGELYSTVLVSDVEDVGPQKKEAGFAPPPKFHEYI